jgi:hypothetical protein
MADELPSFADVNARLAASSEAGEDIDMSFLDDILGPAAGQHSP